MDIKEIQNLIKFVSKSGVEEVKIEREKFKITIRTGVKNPPQQIIVEGTKEDTEDAEYVHRGLAQRNFSRAWTISEDTEVREVQFKDGLLTVKLGKVIPEHHARKDYL